MTSFQRLVSWRGLIALIGSLLMLAGCYTEAPTPGVPATPTTPPVVISDLDIVTGQTVFVPAYAEIFYGSADETLALTTTLAIHNSDPENAIVVSSIRYYDTDGTLVRDYVEAPIRLKPMATTAIVVEAQAGNGGWGTNFLVEWGAETPVFEPVIEAVMTSRQGTEGVSFISEGRVLTETMP
jgi:hypothetical protein